MNTFKYLLIALLLSASSASFASNFFDTSKPDSPFNFGVRVGFNASTQTRSSYGLISNLDGWGTGFNAGAIFDINFKNYLTIQPGFFFESRSNNYSYIYPDKVEYGHTRHYSFKVPIIASVRLNPNQNVRLHLDLGPYISYGLGGSDKGAKITDTNYPFDTNYFENRKNIDFGFKAGIGVKIMKHYYLGIHYEAGILNVWENKNFSGCHKAWTFTIGYDL